MYALVTGASSGIGYAYARVIAQRGDYDLLIVSNEEKETEEKREILQKDFPNIKVLGKVSDLSRQEAAKELYDWCKENNIEVEVLINNAGVYHDRDFLDDSPEFTSLILNLHIYTPTLMTYYFAKDMVAKGKGYVLNMSSVTSNFGFQRMSTYSTTKGFLRLFSRATHIELKEKGVYVTCVRPGAVATPLYNLNEKALKTGLAVGAIITPEKLAKRGIKALFKGKHEITPGLAAKMLNCVAYIPTCVMILVRKLKIF